MHGYMKRTILCAEAIATRWLATIACIAIASLPCVGNAANVTVTNPSGTAGNINSLNKTMFESVGNVSLANFNNLSAYVGKSVLRRLYTAEGSHGFPTNGDTVTLINDTGPFSIAFSREQATYGPIPSNLSNTGGTQSFVYAPPSSGNTFMRASFVFSGTPASGASLNGIAFTANRIQGATLTVQLFANADFTEQVGSDYILVDNTAPTDKNSFFGFYDEDATIRSMRLTFTQTGTTAGWSIDDLNLAWTMAEIDESGFSVADFVIQDTDVQEDRTAPNGSGTTVLAGTNASKINRALFKTYGPDIQDGYALTNATLYLFQDWATGRNKAVDIYRVLSPWDEATATWALSSGTTPWSQSGLQAGVDYVATPTASPTTPATDGFTAFDVTSDVAKYLAGTAEQNGWLVRLQTETGLVRFRTINEGSTALRPYIVYRYKPVPVNGTIIIQPVSADVSFSQPYPNTAQGGDTTLMGTHLGGLWRTMLFANLPEIPPRAEIKSAQLRVYQDWSAGERRLVALHRVLKPWSETSTWNSNSVSTAWATPGLGAGTDYVETPTDVNYMPMNRYSYFEVTDDVRSFAQGEADNYGWVAINQQPTTLVRFRTREATSADLRPVLILRYSIPTATVICVR